MQCCYGPNFRLFEKIKWEIWEKTLFSKLFQKLFTFVLCVYIFKYIIHFWEFIFVKHIWKMNFIKIFLSKSFLTTFLFVHDCKNDFSLLAGNLFWSFQHWGKGKFIWTWCQPEHPKFIFSSYFVSSGRLLLEGSRAFKVRYYSMLLTMKNVTNMLFLQDKCLKQND